MPSASAVPHSQRLAPSGSWRNADFRRLWIGQTASQFGEQATQLVLPLTAILILHAGAGPVGALRAAGQAPLLLLTLFIGAWVDGWRTRTVMVLADVARAVMLSGLAAAIVLGRLGLPALLVAAFALGSLSVFFDVAYQASVVRLVERRLLVQGNSALEGSRSVAQVSGLGLGGLLVSVLPAPIAVASSVPLFALSSLSIHRIRHQTRPERPARRQRVWRQIHAGLRFVAGHALLRGVGLAAAAFQFWFAATMTVLLLFLTRDLHLTGTAVGLVLATAAGLLLSPALMASSPLIRLGRELPPSALARAEPGQYSVRGAAAGRSSDIDRGRDANQHRSHPHHAHRQPAAARRAGPGPRRCRRRRGRG